MTTATAPSRTAIVAADPQRRVLPGVLMPHTAARPSRCQTISPVDPESLSADWQRALDAAGRALRAAGDSLPAWELRDRRVALAREIETNGGALRALREVHDSRRPGCPLLPSRTRCSASRRRCAPASSMSRESSRTAPACMPGRGARCSTTSCRAWVRRRIGTSSRSIAMRTIARTSRGAPGSMGSIRSSAAVESRSPKDARTIRATPTPRTA